MANKRSYAPRFEIFPTWGNVPEDARHLVSAKYFFHIVASNGRILAHGETYHRKADAIRACKAINPNYEIVVKE